MPKKKPEFPGEVVAVDDVMRELAGLASATTKKTLMRHGAPEPLFGVRIGDMKPLVKRLRGRQDIALELFNTRNSDAMYLAGLISDGAQMTRAQLDDWAKKATWHMIAGCAVAWVAAENEQGTKAALIWIDSSKELVAIAGWSTLAAIVSTRPDERLDVATLDALLEGCVKQIHSAPHRIRYAMNNFVICCGTYVLPLAERAIEAARRIGPIMVDMGDTGCRVPDAETYIIKSRRGLSVAPKRKSARC